MALSAALLLPASLIAQLRAGEHGKSGARRPLQTRRSRHIWWSLQPRIGEWRWWAAAQ